MNSQERLEADPRREAVEDESGDIRIGKDEMNLIEFPWAAFGKRTDRQSVIEHTWEARHPITGKPLRASWKVAANPALGLPTAADLRVYLVMMELTREQGWPQVVPFTRHDLIKRLRWPHNQKHYEMLFDAFERLRGTTMSARNTFWDKGASSYRNATFGILDSAEVVAEKKGRKLRNARNAESSLDRGADPGDSSALQDLPPMTSMSGQAIGSYFKWNDILYKSFQDGYLRTFDLNFALSLQSDVALALYRYLGKKAFQGRATFSIELELLFSRHLGLAPAAFPSLMKQRLTQAHTELIERHFLERVEYSAMRSRMGEKVTYTFARKRRVAQGSASTKGASKARQLALPPVEIGAEDEWEERELGALPAPQLGGENTSVSDASEPECPDLMRRMMALGVSATVAAELLEKATVEQLVLQLDCLEDREPRDRAATFVKAVREAWQAPTKYLERQEAQERAKRARTEKETRNARAAQEGALTARKRASQEEESARLDAMWGKLDPGSRDRIDGEARERLGVLGLGGRAPAALQAMRRSLLRERLPEEGT